MPSSMPEGMIRSAPASAWTSAISDSRASVASISAAPSLKSTHCPCGVYAHTQTSVATARSGAASFTAWMARVTTWSRSSSVSDTRSSHGASGTRSRSSTRAETMAGWIMRGPRSGEAKARDQIG